MASFTQQALNVADAKQAGEDFLSGPAAQSWAALSRLVTQLAWSVHFARSQLLLQSARDFAEHGAVGHILAKVGQFRSWHQKNCSVDAPEQTDPFVPWCRKVLENKYTDQVRKQGRELAHRKDVDLEHQESAGTPEPWERLDELSADELARLQSLDPLDGVIVFVLTDKYAMVPPAIWQGWLRGCGMPPTFPPESIRKAGKHQERQALADALGISRNAMDQRISRLKRGRVRKAPST